MFQTIPATFALLTMINGRRSSVDDSRRSQRSPTNSLNYVVSLYDHRDLSRATIPSCLRKISILCLTPPLV